MNNNNEIKYKVGMRLRCNICKREVEILKVGSGKIYCCGQLMKPVSQ
ncbi:MAG: desulfoferrodoxin [Candidatus Schekmanbacteria bacterium]|nr:MAG: desulfoferrodoxin [Candidatus Schekmanbacteria bacterium]